MNLNNDFYKRKHHPHQTINSTGNIKMADRHLTQPPQATKRRSFFQHVDLSAMYKSCLQTLKDDCRNPQTYKIVGCAALAFTLIICMSSGIYAIEGDLKEYVDVMKRDTSSLTNYGIGGVALATAGIAMWKNSPISVLLVFILAVAASQFDKFATKLFPMVL